MRHHLSPAACFLFIALAAQSVDGAESAFRQTLEKDADGREYTLTVPAAPPAQGQRRVLVVWAHGAGGNGRQVPGFIEQWVAKGDCVLVTPSLSLDPPYQYLEGGSEEQVVKLFAALKEKLHLQDKLFVAGFSGGGQFAHRFALAHPNLVLGCAAHSAGTWATGETYGGTTTLIDQSHPTLHKLAENTAAAGIPLLVTCGEKDTGKSFNEAPLGRLEWAKKFAKNAEEAHFTVQFEPITGAAHNMTKQTQDLTRLCFDLATQGQSSLDKHLAEVAMKRTGEKNGKPGQPDIAAAIKLLDHPPQLDERTGGALAKSMNAHHRAAVAEVRADLVKEAMADVEATAAMSPHERTQALARIKAVYGGLKNKELDAKMKEAAATR